jgi:hypothetical protein
MKVEPVTLELAREQRGSPKEFERVRAILGATRTYTVASRGIFSVCGGALLLQVLEDPPEKFPSKGPA